MWIGFFLFWYSILDALDGITRDFLLFLGTISLVAAEKFQHTSAWWPPRAGRGAAPAIPRATIGRALPAAAFFVRPFAGDEPALVMASPISARRYQQFPLGFQDFLV